MALYKGSHGLLKKANFRRFRKRKKIESPNLIPTEKRIIFVLLFKNDSIISMLSYYLESPMPKEPYPSGNPRKQRRAAAALGVLGPRYQQSKTVSDDLRGIGTYPRKHEHFADPVETAPVKSVRKEPGVFGYVTPEFRTKHLRHVNPKKRESEAAFARDTQEMARSRMRNTKPSFGGMESRGVPASTVVGMNRRNLKEMKRFIKDPSTQGDLEAGRPVTFPVTTQDAPRRTARAVTVEPTRTQEYSGPDFTGFSFSSKTQQKNPKGYLMPDHYAGVTGIAKSALMGKSTKF